MGAGSTPDYSGLEIDSKRQHVQDPEPQRSKWSAVHRLKCRPELEHVEQIGKDRAYFQGPQSEDKEAGEQTRYIHHNRTNRSVRYETTPTMADATHPVCDARGNIDIFIDRNGTVTHDVVLFLHMPVSLHR